MTRTIEAVCHCGVVQLHSVTSKGARAICNRTAPQWHTASMVLVTCDLLHRNSTAPSGYTSRSTWSLHLPSRLQASDPFRRRRLQQNHVRVVGLNPEARSHA